MRPAFDSGPDDDYHDDEEEEEEMFSFFTFPTLVHHWRAVTGNSSEAASAPLSVMGAVAVATGKDRYQQAARSNPDPRGTGARERERGNGPFGAHADKIQLRLAQRGFGKAVLEFIFFFPKYELEVQGCIFHERIGIWRGLLGTRSE